MSAAVCQDTADPAVTLRLLGGPVDLEGHRRGHGPLRPIPLPELIEACAQVQLAGRGGAGFPMARKLSGVAGAGRRPVVVVNACEGDPTSAKDGLLIRTAPHLVLDGALLLAGALAARRVCVAVHGGTLSAVALARAIAARPDASGIEIVTVPARFVASEASSLVSLINSGDARPLGALEPIWRRGVDGAPTLVANAETVAQVAVLRRLGARSFAAVGTADEPGTALVTVGGRPVTRPGVFEIVTGTRLDQVLAAAGAPDRGWVLVGGLAGNWITLDRLRGLRFSTAGLAAVGIRRGVASFTVLDDAGCPLVETAAVLQYLAASSAGRCGPCLFGLPAIAADLTGLLAGDPAALPRLRRRLPVINGRGGCGHPDGAVNLAASALGLIDGSLADHASAHLSGAGCAAAPQIRLPRTA